MKKTIFSGTALVLSIGMLTSGAALAADTPNPVFKDSALYNCIRQTQVVSVPTGVELLITDELLAEITDLDCTNSTIADDSDDISDLSGLEKLVNLKTLILDNNRVTKANLKSNTKLEEIVLTRNSLREVVLPASAKYLNVSGNGTQGLTLNTSAAKGLEVLVAVDTYINGPLNLANNTELVTLHLKNNGPNLPAVDIRRNTKLEHVDYDEIIWPDYASGDDDDDPVTPVSGDLPSNDADDGNNGGGDGESEGGGQANDADGDDPTPSGLDVDPLNTPILITSATFDEDAKVLDVTKLVRPDGFIDPARISDAGAPYEYHYVAARTGIEDYRSHTVHITDPSRVRGYVVLGGFNIYVPLNAPDTLLAYFVEPETETEVDPEKDNPDTSVMSKLILGFSILGVAAMAVAIKAILKARAKRA